MCEGWGVIGLQWAALIWQLCTLCSMESGLHLSIFTLVVESLTSTVIE